MKERTAIIIGAGPAGLTAAYELLERTNIRPIVLEATDAVGGISRTVNYKGNRIDIGGHRFFSKSDEVMRWWQNIMPLEGTITGMGTADPAQSDRVMLVRRRLSRIFFMRKFFPYPLSLSPQVLANLGAVRVMKIAVGYFWSVLFPIRPEENLEDFFVNRFGQELYATFFRDYTEKVWGVPCRQISADWGVQRIKGLSVLKSITHAIRKVLFPGSVNQNEVETSLIEQFWYPKFGPGQLWEEVARQVSARGGEIMMRHEVISLNLSQGIISSIIVADHEKGIEKELQADVVLSSMAVRDLVQAVAPPVTDGVRDVADGLMYRDFITVGLLVKKMKLCDKAGNLVPDNWIYIQEPDVKIGRLQIFNNWSPYLVYDPETVWLGLEYFCAEGDSLWSLDNADLVALGTQELGQIGIIDVDDVVDAVVIRVPKAYPAYFGSYDRFSTVRSYLDSVRNLYPIGRNGMHRYNNADHSMLAAMAAVNAIASGCCSKESIWAVNAECDYQEQMQKCS